MSSTTRSITIPPSVDPVAVLGVHDAVLREIEKYFPQLTIIPRSKQILITSHSIESEKDALKAKKLFIDLIDAALNKMPIDSDGIHRLLDYQKLPIPHTVNVEKIRKRSFSLEKSRSHNHSSDEQLGSHSQISVGDYQNKNYGQNKTRNNDKQQLNHLLLGNQHTINTESTPENKEFGLPPVITFSVGVPVRPKTPGQIDYVNNIDHNVITFGIGPAGTGKTYLAVAKAVQAFENNRVRRIILTRPAVEAGESLGFLPGTLNDKIDPYLRPLYDALSDMLGFEQLHRYMNDGSIEVAPLAYMRGRTLNDAFVILDEAQNTTEQQMKMFLTRLGFNTTMVVTGDSTQIDLGVTRSSLTSIERILAHIDTISFVHLTTKDVVRHSLVGKIVQAYDKDAARKEKNISGANKPSKHNQTKSHDQGRVS